MQTILTLEQALGKFISSLSNLIWIIALAIGMDFYLRLQGVEQELASIQTLGSIVWAVVWLAIALRSLSLVESWMERN